MHPALHELDLRAEAIPEVVVPLDAVMADLFDQLLADSFAKDTVDRLVSLSKADDGVGVEEGKQMLQQLRAPPEHFLCLT